MSNYYVINIGRQLGSGGHIIGEKLASRLQANFYDKELIKLASEESGLCSDFFERADERTQQSTFRGLMGSYRMPFASSMGFSSNNCLSHEALFKIQSDVIRRLASEGNCLFMGRCADYILRDHPRVANVFVSASREARIERICQYKQISATEAEEVMLRADKKRAEYYSYYSDKTWGAAESYHLCIDSSVLGIERTTEYIESFVRAKLNL